MKTDRSIEWFFDFISPFAYLQRERFAQLSSMVTISYKPVLFAGLLSHWGHKGPAEIPQKRIFTYRHVQWLSQHLGIPLKFPPVHPFNPLQALRLAIALDNSPRAIEQIFHFIWREGNAVDGEGWSKLVDFMQIQQADQLIAQPEVKRQLIANGEQAVAAGVFGVPTFVVDGHLFWGFDATEMLIDYLQNPHMLSSEEMKRISSLSISTHIKRT